MSFLLDKSGRILQDGIASSQPEVQGATYQVNRRRCSPPTLFTLAAE
jgi:hypothetical protein